MKFQVVVVSLDEKTGVKNVVDRVTVFETVEEAVAFCRGAQEALSRWHDYYDLIGEYFDYVPVRNSDAEET